MKHLILLAGLIAVLASCQQGKNKKVENLAPGVHQVVAGEVIQGSAYTYARVVEDDRDYWIATNKMEIKEGETYFWLQGMEMNDFTSKELNRTFPSIFFIQDLTNQPITMKEKERTPMTSKGRQVPPEKTGISVPVAKDGITIAQLYAKKDSYAGKTVIISGEVIRINTGIMDRNWIHLQDGTKNNGNYDLTITTKDSVNVGEVVTFTGTIVLNKDFGYGYLYDLIMENATIGKKE